MNQNTEQITLDSLLAKQSKPTRGYIRRLITIAFICFILMAIGFWWFIIRSRPLVISPETTFVCEPLTPTKQVDYFAWLKSQQPKELATDENGFRVVLAQVGFFAIGTSDGQTDDNASKIKRLCYEELGLNPNEPRLAPVTDQYRAWVNWLQKKNPDKSIGEIHKLPENLQLCSQKNSWFDEITDDKRQFLQSFLAENEEGINIFTRELCKDCFAAPLVSLNPENSLADNCMEGQMIQEFRTWQRLLAFRAEARIKFGDIDGAIDDIISMKRLARHLFDAPVGINIDFLIAISLEGMAHCIAINANPDKPLSREQWKRLLDDSGENNQPLELKNFILGERIMLLDTIQRAAALQSSRPIYRLFSSSTGLLEDSMNVAKSFILSPGYDWNIIAKKFNKHFDHVIDFDHVRREDDFPTLPLYRWLSITNRTEHYLRSKGILNIDSLFEIFPGIKAAGARFSCIRNLSRIAFALQLYRADHQGEFPPTFTTDGEGRPLHSWRTLLLPYLGYRDIYDQICLDEPWDSETNSRFHHRNIPEFRCPAANLFQEKRSGDCPYPVAGETTYAIVVGNDSGQKLPIVVERVDPILWMSPEAGMSQEALAAGVSQIDTESGKLKNGQPGSFHPGGMNVTMPTGSVQFYVGVE